MPLQRRHFIRSAATASAAAAFGNLVFARDAAGSTLPNDANRFKISLNAYSFNELLRSGKTDLEKLIAFCAREGFDAIDLTGYYFPGYPEPPGDEYIYRLKKLAHRQGIAISGTGIRNEFADPDPAKREAEIVFVKKWIEVAAKLGAPVIRIFTGKTLPEGYTRTVVEQWIVDAIKPCAAYGRQHGVIVAMQNHNDFVKTADEAISLLNRVNSEWFGLVLDTGSFVTHEPYSEIRKTTAYAVNWQVKEQLKYLGKTEQMDLQKLFTIVKESTYRGYLPIETLNPGDPFIIIPAFLTQVKAALASVMRS
ncbi:sugar phosphate isomerase/epimerase family protein [Sediminibacterium soli]|uniref:sugar phosphate isomerase/epimerase family protein n=1 Tax=Sediminibacterium soli TaxID=2698829 RepID=UPI00137AB740|nr:sugar phosphate isomerase/epimerase family protein [Sediminibacterium soli]NCI45633.1 sugar phosphate isomerase/epimerase [Sediminibacterium soli]